MHAGKTPKPIKHDLKKKTKTKIKVETNIGHSLVVLIWSFCEIILEQFWVYETTEVRGEKSWELFHGVYSQAYDKIEERGGVVLKDTQSSAVQ